MDSINCSLALSTPLDSSTRNGVKTCPKREFQKISFFSQEGQEKPRSLPHSTPHSMIHLHSTPPRLSIPPPAMVSQSRICICHTQCVRFCPLDLLSLIARPCRKTTSAAAGLLIMILLQHNGRPVVKARSTQGCGAWIRCYAGALCEECTRVYLWPGYVCVLNE